MYRYIYIYIDVNYFADTVQK